ncbi:MAG TPA: hypothetical protein VGI22_15955 [Xanthobacteraceae bacterium]
MGVTVAAVVPRYCCGDRRIAAGDRPALSPNFILFSFAEKSQIIAHNRLMNASRAAQEQARAPPLSFIK